jgi:hypothetical protein
MRSSSALSYAVWVFAAIYPAPFNAETLTGVLYFKEIGNGTHPAGTIQLAVGNNVRSLSIAPPAKRDYKEKTCDDLGARWTVVILDVPYISRIICSGVDERVHNSWLAVRNYLEGLPSAVANPDLLSVRYRSSEEFRHFLEQVNRQEFIFYSGPGEAGDCLKVIPVPRSTRSRLLTHCAIELQGKRVGLYFDLIRNRTTGKWMIDGIKAD